MNKTKKVKERLAYVVGFLFSFLLFTTIFYFSLRYFKKIPYDWNFFYGLLFTSALVLFGYRLKKYLND